MNISRKSKHFLLGTVLAAVMLPLLIYHGTLYGLAMQLYLPWQEDAFRGKPVAELQASLEKRGKMLEPLDGLAEPWGIKKDGDHNLRVMRFIKGERFLWFPVGTAVNIGFVLIETNSGDGRIVKIIHGRSVDSL